MSQIKTVLSVEFLPTSGSMGREVRGVDLTDPISDDLVEEIKMQLGHHGLLLFRNQDITEKQQLEFTRRFGDAIGHPVPGIGGGDAGMESEKEVFLLVNDPEKKHESRSKLSSSDGTLGWHSDLEYMPEPQVYSILYGMEIPSSGGETEWCNLADAYDALDEETKEAIENIQVVRKIPAVTHPAVRRHPITGRKNIYVSPGLSKYVEGTDEDESKQLLKNLCGHITQERFCYVHTWTQGDVIMWDNRLTLHRRHGFDVTERRVVRRTQTAGEPVLA